MVVFVVFFFVFLFFVLCCFFFFNDTATTEIYTLSLHDALPIFGNVIVTQDSIVVKSAKGYYFGDSEKTYSDTTIHLTNGNMDLLADRGYYYIPAKKAFFFGNVRSEEHTSELQSHSFISYAVFCLKKKNK